MTDDELNAIMAASEDSLTKQRKRSGGRTHGEVNASTASDEEMLRMYADALKVPRATPQRGNFAQPNYAPSDPTAGLGPSTDENLAGTNRALDTEALDRVEGGKGATFEDMRRVMPNSALGRATPRDLPGSEGEAGRGFRDLAAGGLVPMAVAPALAAAGAGHVASNIGAGAAGGAAQAVISGHPADALTAAIMGGAGQGLAGGAGPRAAHEPLTQREIDAATLQGAPKEPPGLPEGEHGNVELAARADRGIRERLAARQAASGEAMNEADADYGALDASQGPVQTFGARARLGDVRQQSMGGSGPTLSSDPVLRRYQDNLATTGGAHELPRPILRNLQKGLNNEADFGAESRDPMAQAALKQGAGVLSDRVRTADPREGPGNIGGALDRYGAEADRLRNAEQLLGPESGSVAKLARVGSADRHSNPSAIQSEREIAQLQDEEPAVDELVNAIRARNTTERRKLQWSLPLYMSPETVAGSTGRNIARNADNLRFKMAPPMINDAGQVAARQPGDMNQAIPLELQMLLLDKEHRHESP